MFPKLVKQKSFTVTGVKYGYHISHVSSDRVWISDGDDNLILTNTAGDKLHHLTDIAIGFGVHTVNSWGDLIYIDKEHNINKLSTDNKVKTKLIRYRTAPWEPLSVYSSPSTGDLLVGMWNTVTETGKLVRYNSTGQHIQTIEHDHTGQELYRYPIYITENRNGDVIVSDMFRGVVVTDREGRNRSSNAGPPSEPLLLQQGICTDGLSRILVCGQYIQTVEILDRTGSFLSKIQLEQHGIDRPQGLSYDERTHLLWVGSHDNNTVNIYRIIYGDYLTALSLQDIKCKKHPSSSLDQFCTNCGVHLCVECTSSEDHSRHDLRYIEDLFDDIHRIKGADTFMMCLLLSQSCKINLKERNLLKKYNDVHKVMQCTKIRKPFGQEELRKYMQILKITDSEVSFLTDLFQKFIFLKLSKNSKFVDIFMNLAEKENIAEYCRSWLYPKKEDEFFCWLSPQQTEQLIEKLGEDIFKHPTMDDQSIHEAVFRKFGIPMQIIVEGEKYVKQIIDILRKGKTMMYHASGMIIGCAGSGKTTLLERLKGINLAEIKKNINSTRGIDIYSDVFDVTDGIKVSSSHQQQRLKLRLDERNRHQYVPEYSTGAADYVERLDKVEPVDVKGTRVEESNHGQIIHDNANIQTTLLYERKGASLPENAMEVIRENHDVSYRSEISGILQIDTKNTPEKKITMTDFAGQCAYYASHQIFLSPREFFILVLNMEKKFDDKVGKEVCSQKGSIFEGWTYRDYLEFWMKSIHQHSNDQAPVLLVGTHSENKTEEGKMLFFREIWRTVETKKKSLHKHLDVKRQFATGFHNNQSIEKIKLAIVDVVHNLDHWGEEVPHSWALFEIFFQEKKILKILNKNTLEAFNKALPHGIKLQTIEDMNVMLQFFHDIREILYFDQEFLKEVIILDVQWFADAFKNVITDENHAKDDLFQFALEWDRFSETGELDDHLLYAIWKMNNNGYIEHKDEIILYMEKLGLLAKMNDKKWYVPCMNKMPFPGSNFTEYPASSILCYTFDVLPAGIFHSLVATCMQIPWKIFSDKERGCIYQTGAIFEFRDQDHNILLGMTQTDIQLQVFVVEGDVDVSTCHQIRENIERILLNLSNTFQKNSEFNVAFKCKPGGFCDSKISAVIDESEFRRATFQCPSCPANEKHPINTKEITKYWKQVPEEDSKYGRESEVVSSAEIHENTENTESIDIPVTDNSNANMEKIRKLLQVGTEKVRACFDLFFPKEKLEKVLKDNETDIRKGQFRFHQAQLEILFPSQGGSNSGVSSLSLDITIMYKLLRNYSDITPPGNGWGKDPKVEHITESDDIERIRRYRNTYYHDSGSNQAMKDEVFNAIWDDLSQLIRYARAFSTYEQSLKRGHLLTNKLMKEEYQQSRLKSSFRKFYGRYNDLVSKYNLSLSQMLTDFLC